MNIPVTVEKKIYTYSHIHITISVKISMAYIKWWRNNKLMHIVFILWVTYTLSFMSLSCIYPESMIERFRPHDNLIFYQPLIPEHLFCIHYIAFQIYIRFICKFFRWFPIENIYANKCRGSPRFSQSLDHVTIILNTINRMI